MRDIQAGNCITAKFVQLTSKISIISIHCICLIENVSSGVLQGFGTQQPAHVITSAPPFSRACVTFSAGWVLHGGGISVLCL